MAESEPVFEELKRYVRFGESDESLLRTLAEVVRPRQRDIAEQFYARILEHPDARAVFADSQQVERLKGTLVSWLELLLSGPWDQAYFERRTRIGRMHVKVNLPQRYMFAAMDVIRTELVAIAHQALQADAARCLATVVAVDKIVDLELAVMLESFADAHLEKVQRLERLEKSVLERQLEVSRARYQEIVESSGALVATFAESGMVHLVNGQAAAVLGVERDGAVGRDFIELFFGGDDARAAARERLASLRAGERAPELTARVPGHGDGPGRLVRWHFTQLPGDGDPVLCAMGVDVTDEHDMAERTRRAERLAALGTMAAGLAHEIRNPLNAAHLQLTLVMRRLGKKGGPDVEGAADAAELVAAEMRRLAALVDEFLQFARPQPLRCARVDLRETAAQVVELMAPEAEKGGVDLSLVAAGPVTSEVDDERIKQVLLNLVKNAIEATGKGGVVQVRVHNGDAWSHLEVADNGPGLPPGGGPIFEPFFTTKEQGTGLGLAIVHRIVADHGGHVQVESRPGRTRFAVLLPR